MSFHGKHDGVPCQVPNCRLPIDLEQPVTDLTNDELREIMETSFGVQTEQPEQDDFAVANDLEIYNREFEVRCAERHVEGAEKYGPGKFLTVDTVDEALQEVADLANYARYTYIRLCLIREWIISNMPVDVPTAQGFVKSKEATQPRRES